MSMRVINKNSGKDGDHEPLANSMVYGEIAVNYNATNPRILIKDSNNKVVGFPSEKKVNEQFTAVNGTITNLGKSIDENAASIGTLNDWIATPLTDEEIASAFV